MRNLLKDIDLFKMSADTLVSRKNRKSKKKRIQVPNLGSFWGGISTICIGIFLFGITFEMIKSMYSGNNDII